MLEAAPHRLSTRRSAKIEEERRKRRAKSKWMRRKKERKKKKRGDKRWSGERIRKKGITIKPVITPT